MRALLRACLVLLSQSGASGQSHTYKLEWEMPGSGGVAASLSETKSHRRAPAYHGHSHHAPPFFPRPPPLPVLAALDSNNKAYIVMKVDSDSGPHDPLYPFSRSLTAQIETTDTASTKPSVIISDDNGEVTSSLPHDGPSN